MAQPVFTLNDVRYQYPGGIPAVVDLNLTINQGECGAIIGANGTGKSTLLTLLDALVFPTSGTIRAFGRTLTEIKMNDPVTQHDFRHRVGFVFQNPDIQLFCSSVREDILFGPLQMNVSHEESLRRLASVTRLLRIEHLLDRSPHQLSIGEKKKACIASVLVMEPDVLLFDEPTAGLDPQTTRDIAKVLFDAHTAGKTVVMATHDFHIVEEIADIVHVFGNNHSIIRSGTPDEILCDDNFLQENNLIHTHVHRTHHHHHYHRSI